jgi:hypothetical protein
MCFVAFLAGFLIAWIRLNVVEKSKDSQENAFGFELGS